MLSIRLTKRLGDFVTRLALPPLCPVPLAYPTKAEGVDVPPPGSGPYYIATWTPDHELVLKRNRFYRGGRPHHVAQFVTTIGDDPDTITREIDRSQVDWGCGSNFGCSGGDVPTQAAGDLGKKYGVNRIASSLGRRTRSFTSRSTRSGRCFGTTPRFGEPSTSRSTAPLLSALAVPTGDRRATAYLPRGRPRRLDVHPYPTRRTNLGKARALARGHRRGGRRSSTRLTTTSAPHRAHIVQRDLKRSGIRVIIKQYPIAIFFEKVGTEASRST